ncbi:MAG: DUF4339 domain-containing protein [Gemmataceae bacterium]
MNDFLHVVRDGKWFGPFSSVQLRALVTAGRLRLTDSVWKEGMAQAVLAAKVKNLFPALRPRPRSPVVASAGVTPAALSPTPTVSSSGVRAAAPQPTPPQEVAATPEKPAPAVPPALPGAATQPSQHKAGANAVMPSQPRKRRAIAMKGAVLLSQDGYKVQYRKKCSLCGFEDTSRSTMLINVGITRSHFFCPKCRKNGEVQIQGCMQ